MTNPPTRLAPSSTVWLYVLAFCASGLLVFWPEGLSFEMGGLGGGLASFSEGLAWWRGGGLLFVGG
ncbi:MAG: hypothetical protein FWC18_06975, partial [Cystobacterineae bacterium]|nr:hypothetical protein [Cystobacterineae bacterium]